MHPLFEVGGVGQADVEALAPRVRTERILEMDLQRLGVRVGVRHHPLPAGQREGRGDAPVGPRVQLVLLRSRSGSKTRSLSNLDLWPFPGSDLSHSSSSSVRPFVMIVALESMQAAMSREPVSLSRLQKTSKPHQRRVKGVAGPAMCVLPSRVKSTRY